MRKLLLLILLLSIHLINAQNETEKVSIKFENSLKTDVVNQIEKITKYRFYFIESWLDNSPISGEYNNVSIAYILDDIFKETVINYHITSDKKIILTSNSLIYDSFPEDLFGSTKKEIVANKKKEPIFFVEEISPKKKAIKTVRIGKEIKSSAQKTYKLSGYVKNISTGKPISNSVITVQGENTNVVTDVNGFYTIQLAPGENFIEIKSLGIETLKRRIVIYSDETLNFEVTESTEELDEVVIEADENQNVNEVITGITKIEVEEIKNIPLVLGERDILKVATSLPGITNAGEGSAGYNVRGGKEDQNLILLDNVVLYNPSHFFGIFSALNPFTSEDVTIYKGNIPAEHGGRLSSVFDITTKNANSEKLSGEASIGPVTSNLTLEIPIKKNKSSLLFGARGTYSDWILRSLNDESLKKSKASFYDVVAKYNHEINENNNIEVTGYFSKDAFSITSDSLYTYSNKLMSLKWKHKFSNKNIGSFILTDSEYKFNIGYEGNSDTNFDLGYKVNETELKIKMNYLLNDKHKLNYGISTKLYRINPGSIDPKGSVSIIEALNIPKEKALESALFISDNFKVNEEFLLNVGLRYSLFASLGKASQRVYEEGVPKNEGTLIDVLTFEENEVIKTYGGPEIRVSARYFLSSDLSLKASYNSTYQYIHALSDNTTVSPTDTWKLSDLNIKPQQATQYSLGLYKNSNNNIYEFSIEGYYKKSKNILDYKVGADLLLNENIEAEVLQGEGKAYGIEFLIRKTKGKLNGWLGYSYARSLIKFDSDFNEERVNNGAYFPSNYDKPHDVSLVTNYKLTKRYSLSANLVYQTGRPITFPVGNYIYNGSEYVAYSNRNQFRIPDYYRLDLGFNIEGNHKKNKLLHSFWNISVYNVLGRNNPYSVFFVSENGKIKAYKSSIFSIPVPTITYNFKF
jgi:carboxypeptidase-like protein/TonB-dependent receptor-like protein